ncbi:glycosyltransferase family 2 protein [Spirosoma agri]|uniref:Glycosyltransferase family 2 protein n=1 Tax=Spirosoma agri TaxID=1987381 RepID=A0A6M0INV9_9BACT|nr:glycosyltransferase family 2 protein [Spirosoma agri]
MKQPLISIIIPTYNRGHLIDVAIRSVQAQQYTNWQLIVIDDGSTDDTKERLSRYSTIQYHRQENRGQAAARNAGLQYCQGEYIASLDSDDEWHPNFLFDGMTMLQKHQLDFVFMNWQTSKGTDGYASYFMLPKHRKQFCSQGDNGWWILDPKQNRCLMVETCPSPSSSLIIRRAAFPGAWNERMRIADDWCMILDMVINRACRSAFSPVPHWTKHIHGDNIWDCQDNTVIIPEVGFHDEQVLIERFGHQLTAQEKRVFRRRLALHHFNFAYFSWKQAVASSSVVLRHLTTAFRLSPSAISRIVVTWGQEHVQKRLVKRRVKSLPNELGDAVVGLQAERHSELTPIRDPQTAAGATELRYNLTDNGLPDSAAMPAGRT